MSNETKGISREIKTIFVKSGLETHQIVVNDIEYLQKDGNYIYYFVNGKKIMGRQSIVEALSQLGDNFFQIQKSYIVNLKKIESITTDYVVIHTVKIPIGLQYKKHLVDKLQL